MSDIKTVLYRHIPHRHELQNVNTLHAQEQQNINARIAVTLTRIVGSMPTAYIFVVLAIVGLLAILGVLSPIVALLVAWTSQTLIQLVLLPVIMVGQNVLSRKQELQADEMFSTTQYSFSDIEEIMHHLDAQDSKILEVAQKIEKMEQIASTETLNQGDAIKEILEIVKYRSQSVALTPAVNYEAGRASEQTTEKKGKAKG